MSTPQSFSKVADGNIRPYRFVKLSTTTEGRVLEADAGNKIYGISQEGTRRPPYSGLDDGFAAIQGESLRIYGQGAKCFLTLGGDVTAGDRLKSDADGQGVTASSDTEEYGAIAELDGVSGDRIPVFVTLGNIAG